MLRGNSVWDENIYYIPQIILFYENLISLNFTSILQNNISEIIAYIYSIIPLFLFDQNFLPLILNFISVFFGLIILFYIFNNIFKFKLQEALLSSLIVIITFGYGPTTLFFFKILIFDFSFIDFPVFYRQISPSIPFIFLCLFFISLKNFFEGVPKLKDYIFISLVYFVYPFYTLFVFILSSFLILFSIIKLKKIKKNNFRFLLISFFSFITWYYSISLNNIDVYKNFLGAEYNLNFDYKNLIIYFIFILINLFLFNKNRYSKIFLTIFFTLLICINLKFLTRYDFQVYHFDMYIAKPFQFINLFYIFFTLKRNINIRLIYFLSLILTSIFFYANFNFNKIILNDDNRFILEQLNLKSSYDNIVTYTKKNKVYSLDPLFLLWGSNITKNYNYIHPASKKRNEPPMQNIKNYVKLSKFHGLSLDQTIKQFEDYNFEYFGKIYNSKANSEFIGNQSLFHYILFHQDGSIDGIFRTLGNEFNYLNLKSLIGDLYEKTDVNDIKGLILIHKRNNYEKAFFSKSQIIYEDENIVLYER